MKIATAPSRLSKKWRTSDVTWDWMLKRLRKVRGKCLPLITSASYVIISTSSDEETTNGEL